MCGYRMGASAGSATDNPMVETSRTDDGDSVRRRNNTAQRNSPRSGEKTKIVTTPARCAFQPQLTVAW